MDTPERLKTRTFSNTVHKYISKNIVSKLYFNKCLSASFHWRQRIERSTVYA